MRISNAAGMTIPAPVHRDRLCAPTDYDISRFLVMAVSTGSCSTRAGADVGLMSIAYDLRRKGVPGGTPFVTFVHF
jgi:hypothetical protein